MSEPNLGLKRGAILSYCYSDVALINSRRSLDPNMIKSLTFEQPETLGDIPRVWGTVQDGNHFNTNETRAIFHEKVSRSLETGVPLTISTVVCPPYSKEKLGHRKNKGLMDDFSEDPIDHNFVYSYKVVADAFAQSVRFMSSQGVPVNPVFIIGDWALRDLEGIMKMYPTETDVLSALNRFSESAQLYFDDTYPDLNIRINTFSQLGINNILPLGMPQTPEGKRDFVIQQLEENQSDEKLKWLRTIHKHLSIATDEDIEQLIDPGSWKSFNAPDDELSKKQWINFFQLLRNTVLSRATEVGDKYTQMTPMDAGLYDALMKGYEYISYGEIIAARDPNQIMLNFDTKYPAAGLYYQEGGLDNLFLDTRNYFIDLPGLGIKFNPF